MTFQNGLARLAIFAACILILQGTRGLVPPEFFTGQVKEVAYATQGSDPDYERIFGEDWESVRTFRLLQPLETPLKVYVDTSPAQGLYKPQYRGYVETGLKMWASALNDRLSYRFVSRPQDADVTVHWVPAFPDRYTAGLTVYRVGHARIKIKTVGVPEADIKANIIHEIGHALGIAGHSRSPEDIMVGMRRWQRDGSVYNPRLSERDVRAIQHLYSLDWHKGEDLYAEPAQQIAGQNKAPGSSQSAQAAATADKSPLQPINPQSSGTAIGQQFTRTVPARPEPYQ